MHPAPFIVGVPRSGTTLLRLMLDAHSQLAIPAETHFTKALLRLNPGVLDQPEALLACTVGSQRWPDFHLDAEDFEARLRGLRPYDLGEGLRLFYRLCARRMGKSRWGDKTPDNLLYMPAIAALLPEARFVHIIRDGRDVALSIISKWWGPSNLPDAALWWRQQILSARETARALPHYLEVRYEDLLARPEAVLRRVATFLELPWEDGMLDYHTHAASRMSEMVAPFRTASGEVLTSEFRRSYHQKVVEPPDVHHVELWRTQISREAQADFWAIAGDLLKELGYPE